MGAGFALAADHLAPSRRRGDAHITTRFIE